MFKLWLLIDNTKSTRVIFVAQKTRSLLLGVTKSGSSQDSNMHTCYCG